MKALRLALLLAVVGAFPPTVLAQAPGSGIAGTKHDFSGRTVTGTTAVTGLCTYCHTPHQAFATLLLWNHRLSANNFSWDATATTAGTTFPTISGPTYKGATAKCLSCHDGSVAIGDVAWFDAVGPGGGLGPNPGGTGGALIIDTQKISGSRQIATATGGMSGNHPTAMPFPYQGVASTYNGRANGSGIVLDEWRADPVALGIRLFNDDGSGNISAGAVSGKTGIECASCHDPHNKKVEERYFLRGTLSGNTVTASSGYICLKCHIK